MRLPFADVPHVQVCFPEPGGQLPDLVRTHEAELAQELGAPPRDAASTARWLIGPAAANPAFRELGIPASDRPQIQLDRSRQLLVTDGPDVAAVMGTWWRLFDLARLPDGIHDAGPCTRWEAVADRVDEQIGASHVALAKDASAWHARSAAFRAQLRDAPDPVPVVRRWLATLHDGHTFARPRGVTHAPYGVQVSGDVATFVDIPPESAGARAGLVPGSRWHVDGVADAWHEASAAPHAKAWAAGRRLLEGPPGERWFEATRPTGERVRWSEAVALPSAETSLAWEWRDGGELVLRIGWWAAGAEARMREALALAHTATRLTVDLRGNPGGNKLLAERFRAAFHEAPRRVGRRISRRPDGSLSEPVDIWVAAAEEGVLRTPTRLLVDGRTASAAEDVVLGLKGLPQVTVVGEPTAGALGWIRQVPLTDTLFMMVRYCVVELPDGTAVDGRGVAPDRGLARGSAQLWDL